MPRYKNVILVVIVLALTGLACGETSEINIPLPSKEINTGQGSDQVLEKGDRRLEIHITDPENGDYDQSIAAVRGIGAESVSLSVFWDDIEISPGVYSPDPNWLEIANLYYPANNLKVSLVISVLDTTESRLPKDLLGKSMDDPQVVSRFIDLLEYIKTQIPDLDLTSLAIGNEIDGVLGNDQKAWLAFQHFFETSAPKARELWPDVPIGSKIMFNGLTGALEQSAQQINLLTDIVMVTYYPLDGDFSVKEPDVVLADFKKLVELYPNREIHFTEIGYPTSDKVNSSPEKQAEFIHYMFQAWDLSAEQISVLSYSWLTDLPNSSVRDLEAYYGLSDPGFAEFLRTLGLRTYPGSGEDKLGYLTFLEEARNRGW